MRKTRDAQRNQVIKNPIVLETVGFLIQNKIKKIII